MINYGTSAGWCPAGSGHGVPGDDERERAEWMLQQYPETTVLRQFFSGPLPTSIPNGRAISALVSSEQVGQCEVALSHVDNPGAPVMPLVDALLQAGVPRVTLFGRHEPYEKVSPAQFEAEMVAMRQQIPADLLGEQVHIGPCWILYRDRIGEPADRARFATPALLNAATMQAWDCYPSNPDDLGTSGGPANPKSYEPVADFLAYPISTASRDGHPWAIGELNHKRVNAAIAPATNDPYGEQRARFLADVHRHADEQGALFVAQFHYNNGSLFHPTSASGAKIEAGVWREVCRTSLRTRRAYLDGAAESDGGYDRGRADGLQFALDQLAVPVASAGAAASAVSTSTSDLSTAVDTIGNELIG